MPLTYESLTQTATSLRDGNEDILTEELYSDAELQALYRDGSKEVILLELQTAAGTEDMDVIDEITDTNAAFLRMALGYRQLATFYRAQDAGDGSVQRRRWEYYERLYAQQTARFGALRRSGGVAVQSDMIRR